MRTCFERKRKRREKRKKRFSGLTHLPSSRSFVDGWSRCFLLVLSSVTTKWRIKEEESKPKSQQKVKFRAKKVINIQRVLGMSKDVVRIANLRNEKSIGGDLRGEG